MLPETPGGHSWRLSRGGFGGEAPGGVSVEKISLVCVKPTLKESDDRDSVCVDEVHDPLVTPKRR